MHTLSLSALHLHVSANELKNCIGTVEMRWEKNTSTVGNEHTEKAGFHPILNRLGNER